MGLIFSKSRQDCGKTSGKSRRRAEISLSLIVRGFGLARTHKALYWNPLTKLQHSRSESGHAGSRHVFPCGWGRSPGLIPCQMSWVPVEWAVIFLHMGVLRTAKLDGVSSAGFRNLSGVGHAGKQTGALIPLKAVELILSPEFMPH